MRIDYRNETNIVARAAGNHYNNLKAAFRSKKPASEIKAILSGTWLALREYNKQPSEGHRIAGLDDPEPNDLEVVYYDFIQNLFYYLTHTIEDRDYVTSILSELFEIDFFLYGEFFIDPKEGFTALNSLCMNGYSGATRQLLEKAGEAFGGKNTDRFRDFLTQVNKDQFSPLNTACKEGHTDIVKQLLADAEIAFGGKNTDGFRNFLTQVNKDQFSPLETACKEGHTDIVKQLLVDAEIAFGGKNTDGFRDFLTHPNKDQFSPLNSAAYGGHTDIIDLLIINAKQAFGSSFVTSFLEQKNRYGFTPLNATAHEGKACLDPVKKRQYASICLKLVAEGADPATVNKRGFSAARNWPEQFTGDRDGPRFFKKPIPATTQTPKTCQRQKAILVRRA